MRKLLITLITFIVSSWAFAFTDFGSLFVSEKETMNNAAKLEMYQGIEKEMEMGNIFPKVINNRFVVEEVKASHSYLNFEIEIMDKYFEINGIEIEEYRPEKDFVELTRALCQENNLMIFKNSKEIALNIEYENTRKDFTYTFAGCFNK